MEPFIGVTIFIVMLVTPVACLRWVLGPLDRAAKDHQFPVQFSLADLLCLFVLVQLPLGGLHFALRGEKVEPGFLIADAAVIGVSAAVWWTYVRTLSRAGIHVVSHRCIALTIVLPIAFVGSIAVVALPPIGLELASGGHVSLGVALVLAELPLFGVLYGRAKFTRSIVAPAEAQRKPMDDGLRRKEAQ
ncbi:MAG: hypothetical protein ABFC96_05740 [Thermoguttaceae bacterium]